jgi:hypothetical protein
MLWFPSRLIGTTLMPGVSMGTMNMEMPLCLATVGSVRVASQM